LLGSRYGEAVMAYLIIVGCDNPVNARLLTHANGTTQVFAVKSDADNVVDKINKAREETHARLVAV
jgi:hypothetical protein